MLINTGISINNVDITNYIAFNGLKWSRNDVDGPNAGRTMTGEMVRDVIATKIRLDITCRPLKSDEFNTLLNLIIPEFVSVTYDDPLYGVVTKTMYANNHGGNFFIHNERGEEWWEGITFPLVEK